MRPARHPSERPGLPPLDLQVGSKVYRGGVDSYTMPISLSSKPTEPAIACTLDVGAMPGRLDDWHSLLSRAVARTRVADGRLRIEFDNTVDVSELAHLVMAEQQCCAF